LQSRTAIRPDHEIIFRIVKPRSKVLDLGCGTGDLLYLLASEKEARVQGVEWDDGAVYECVKKGLSVFQGDIESGLSEYPDRAFDYVILNQSMQEVKKVDSLIGEALRVGSIAIIGFPNFAHLEARKMLFLEGRSPVTKSLPYAWYDTPNLRFLSILDFVDFCSEKKLKILEAHYLGDNREIRFLPNLRARNAIFVLTKQPEMR
jgi:methionine biosynthesis protein MetW